MVTDAPISTLEGFSGRTIERRRRQRIVVQWPVRLWKLQQDPLDTHTVNVSSDGFFCICARALSPGETLPAVLEIPGSGTDHASQKLMLRCDVLVVRVETLSDTRKCGVACRILNYSVLRDEGTPCGNGHGKSELKSPSLNFDDKSESAAYSERS